jgi:ribosomal protein L11 methyltransferase
MRSHAAIAAAATPIASLDTDEQSARRIVDLAAESFDADDAAVSMVDKGGGRWQVLIHFDAPPDEDMVRALVDAAAGPMAAAALTFAHIAATDWVRESLAGLKPVLAGRFVVHGAHDRATIPANRIGIEIEAALAFGTGHHGTTRGCLLALDGICKKLGARRKLNILDLGTGSGVLAIAAARALRRRVLATDVDPAAVRVARANCVLNHAGPFVEVVTADGVTRRPLLARAPFDLVFANILLRPLQRFAAPLIGLAAPGGRLVLSGLLKSQANAALAAYGALALEHRIDIEGWSTLVMIKRTRRR